MTDNELHKPIRDKIRLAELKRQARKVRSRHPKHRQGGRGSCDPGGVDTSIDPLASKNSPQKGLTQSANCEQVVDETFVSPTHLNLGEETPQVGVENRQEIPQAMGVDRVIGEGVKRHGEASEVVTREDRWRGEGDVCGKVLYRPLNPRLLMVLLPGGKRVRALVHPAERDRFVGRGTIWLRPEGGGDLYRVVGRYSRWGVRHS